jgi:hypothetical protein
MSKLSPSAFIASIISDVQDGISFVPLVGSGFSAASGILMGQDFGNYLAHATYLTLAPLDNDARAGSRGRRWNILEAGWPPDPSPTEVERAVDWIRDAYEALCNGMGLEIAFDSGKPGKIKSVNRATVEAPTRSTLSDVAAGLGHPFIPYVLKSPEADDADTVRRSLLRAMGISSDDVLKAANPNISLTSEEAIIERGIRALYDWRETIHFLSMLRVEEGRLSLGESVQSVKDGFNSHITGGRSPNLGHKMLAHLSEPLRIRLVLTTNFDELIEKAFERYSSPIEVIPVSIKAGLPDFNTVHAQNCIVKLHGARLDTRADMSLDDDPSVEDKQHFADYLGIPATRNTSAKLPGNARRLLVVGFSGSDPRIIQLIKFALDADHSRELVVYWICFNDADIARCKRLFPPPYEQSFRFVVDSRPDLLCYELYQRVFLCLPQGGLTYEFSHGVPPLRHDKFDFKADELETARCLTEQKHSLLDAAATALSNQRADSEVRRLARDVLAKQIGDAVIAKLHGVRAESEFNKYFSFQTYQYQEMEKPKEGDTEPPKPRKTPLERVFVFQSAGGGVRTMREPFSVLGTASGRQAFWFELQDYANPDSLLRDILRVIALRLGYFQRQQVVLHPLENGLTGDLTQRKLFVDRLKAQFEDFRFAADRCDLFLYGRDVPGGCAGWMENPWTEAEYDALGHLLWCLNEIGARVIYLPFTEGRCARKQTNRQEQLERLSGEILKPVPAGSPFESVLKDYQEETREARTACETNLEEWPEALAKEVSVFSDMFEDLSARLKESVGQPRKLEFLYVMTLFRHARHPNALIGEGTLPCPYRFNARGIDNDWIRDKMATEWIDELRQSRVLFTKPGGYLWMHRDCRLGLRAVLDSGMFEGVRGDPGWVLAERRARAHFWIGDWYFKAFATSRHTTPALESIFHRLQTIRFARWARPKKVGLDKKDSLQQYREILCRSALSEVLKTLRLARQSLKYWLASAAEVSMFSQDTATHLKEKLCVWISAIYDPAVASVPAIICTLIDDIWREMVSLGESLRGEAGVSLPRRYWARDAGTQGKKNSIELILPPDLATRGLEHFMPNAPASPELEREFVQEWTTLFEKVGFRPSFELLRDVSDAVAKEPGAFETRLSERKGKWLVEHSEDGDQLRATIWLLLEHAYVLARRAKMKYHLLPRSNDNEVVPREVWQQVCVACNIGVDFCKHLPAQFLADELRLKARAHTLYSLGLANLGRFYEAHRHLNDAQALLSLSGEAGRVDFAVVCLRRVEAYLTECYYLNSFIGLISDEQKKGDVDWDSRVFKWRGAQWSVPQESKSGQTGSKNLDPLAGTNRILPVSVCAWLMRIEPHKMADAQGRERELLRLKRVYTATLDDAWAELDRAEWFLAGESQSSLWWGRLATLRLRCYGLLPADPALAKRSLLFRRSQDPAAIAMWLHRADRSCTFNPFRRIRAIEYFLDARRASKDIFDESLDAITLEHMWPAEDTLPKFLKTYLKRVKGDAVSA